MDFLIIDNDRTCREAICFMLEAEGHTAEGVNGSELVRTQLEKNSYDAVLVDLDLGMVNGLDLLLEFQETLPGLPLVLVASEVNWRLVKEAMRRGAFDLLEKPFRREHLISLLARLQRQQQLHFRIEQLEQNARLNQNLEQGRT